MILLKIAFALLVAINLPHMPPHSLKWHTRADYAVHYADIDEASAAIYRQFNQTLSLIHKKEDAEAILAPLMDRIDQMCAFQMTHWFHTGPILRESLRNPEI